MKPQVNRNYLELYQETAKNRVFEVLFKYPDKEFSLSDLAREAGVAKTNIGDILAGFQDAGLVTIEKLSKIWRIKANRASWLFIRSKIVYNLNFVYNSGLVEYLIDAFKNPKAIILFGSFRKGEDLSGSDIDIAVESDEAAGYETIGLKGLSGFEKLIGRNIQIHIFNRRAVDAGVFNNIANGVLLWGFLEVKK